MESPSPKKNYRQWAEPKIYPRFVANYSLEFVDWCLQKYAKKDGFIIDIFSGSSTTLLSSSYFGAKSLGIELNPVWVIYGKSRLIRDDSKLNNNISDTLKDIKNNDKSKLFYKGLFEDVIYNQEVKKDIVLIVTAILLSFRNKCNVKYGLNHSWPKISANDAAIPNYYDIKKSIVKLLQHVKWVSKSYPDKCRSKIIFGDSLNEQIYPEKFDLLITSPPYLSRLDYIVATKPENILLKLIELDFNEYELRKKQIGTPIINENDSSEYDRLPNSCKDIIKQIHSHISKGSKNYYSKIAENYFVNMNKIAIILTKKANKNAKIILVIRDSWYKNIYIPTSDLLINIFHEKNWKYKNILEEEIDNTILQVNPHVKKWRQNSKVYEKVVIMEN